MASKRKRSGSTGSPSSISSMATQWSRDASSSPCPDVKTMDNAPQWPNATPHTYMNSSNMDSRTRKRHRDNRPDPEIVHANTYQKLFTAARSSPPQLSTPSSSPATQPRPSMAPRQPSLHNFWTINTPPTSAPEDISMNPPSTSNCEDCEAPLPIDQDVCMDESDEAGIAADFTCRNCRRRVCDMCAVIETGLGRDCLQCKIARSKWVGGLGWLPVGR